MKKEEELSKSEDNKFGDKVKILYCPICGIQTVSVEAVHETQENVTALWYKCNCGVIFQEKPPEGFEFTPEKILSYTEAKQYDLRSIHASRCYANIVEELTYGRTMLDVGCVSNNNMRYFANRGWLTWGIDLNPHVKKDNNIYTGNFETFDFQPKSSDIEVSQLIKDKKIKRTFDFIWMSHVLEHFVDPLGALKKAFDLLGEDGVLFIATPDIDFITKTGIPKFPHWKKKEHYIMWNERSLRRELEKLDFKVIMSRRNLSMRFMSLYDVHLIAQKSYF